MLKKLPYVALLLSALFVAGDWYLRPALLPPGFVSLSTTPTGSVFARPVMPPNDLQMVLPVPRVPDPDDIQWGKMNWCNHEFHCTLIRQAFPDGTVVHEL